MPVDGSESRGNAQAKAVAALPHASGDIRVTLLHVFDDEETAETTTPRQLHGGRAAYSGLREAGVSVDQLSLIGDPAAEILGAADDIAADSIVLGGRKRSPLGSLLFGSVTQEVVLDADRPVTVTGGERESSDYRSSRTSVTGSG